jgi:pimeloyl-ACP methyl ester carboxylesterase
MSRPDLVLPRPGAPFDPQPPIPGPSESSFTQTFGSLLPPAQYLTTPNGKAAYYDFPPTTSSTAPTSPSARVLLIHGVQTPALGLYPLTKLLRTHFPQHHFVLLDLWGHGLSDTPFAPHTPALFHTLIDALLDHLSWPSAHLIGFSFGGALTVGYVASQPARVQSFALIAPAGLLRRAAFDDAGRQHLAGGGDEVAAREFVLSVLNGANAEPPSDWRERVARGEVVAKALKEWQMREHSGHGASVVGVFRDGGVMDQDEVFGEAVRTGVRNLVVLGEEDDVVGKEELEGLGFRDVKVIGATGHEVVREKAEEVAVLIGEFWGGLDGAR